MTWRRFFDGLDPVHALVAGDGEALIGFAHYLFHRSTAQIGSVCYLQDLFTVEIARSRGAGRALIEGCVRAKAGGASLLEHRCSQCLSARPLRKGRDTYKVRSVSQEPVSANPNRPAPRKPRHFEAM